MSFERIGKHTIRGTNKRPDPAEVANEDAEMSAAKRQQLAMQQQPGETDADYTKRLQVDQNSKLSRADAMAIQNMKTKAAINEDNARLLPAEIIEINATSRFVKVKHGKRKYTPVMPSDSGVADFNQHQFLRAVSADSEFDFSIVINRNGRDEEIRLKRIRFDDLKVGMTGVVIDGFNVEACVGWKSVRNWGFITDLA